jgi:flagellar protein FliL
VAKENGEKVKKKIPLKFIIIAVAVVILAGGGLTAWWMIGGDRHSAQGDDRGQKPGTEVTASLIFSMNPFVVNLNDPGGKRYLKTKIDLEYAGAGVTEELKQRQPQVRDAILLLLSGKSLEDIQGVEGKIILRRELVSKINQVLTKGKIRNLYFTQFVIQ